MTQLEVPAFVSLFIALWTAVYLLRRRLFSSGPLDNIPGPPGLSWVEGSLNQLANTRGWEFHRQIAETYGPVIRTKGAFGADALYVFDPKALYHILVKDQYIYEETDRFIEGNKIMFGGGIFTALGEEHRRQRKMLNPVFSITHMRAMVPIFYDVAHKVERVFLGKASKGPQEVDIINWTNRLALELIGQGGLGYSFDELTETSVQHPFGVAAASLLPLQANNEVLRTVVMPKIARIGSPAFRKFLVQIMPMKKLQELRKIVDVIYGTSVEIFNAKKKALESGDEAFVDQIGKGKDIISILMKANMTASEEDRLADNEVIGQIGSLAFAAMDTTSTAISRILHLLALHKDVQTKLRNKIRAARYENGGKDIGYDDLVALPYLDAVCRETLRLYPPVPVSNRTARKDIILPLSNPIKGINGDLIHEIHVPQGTNVNIATLSSNRNPDLWGPDAYEWKPDRWLKMLPEAVLSARMPGIYSHLMTFIGGGRACLGFKFSQLEMKVVLALLLENLEFSVSDKPIVWQLRTIVQPNIDPDSVRPTMPMITHRGFQDIKALYIE